MQYWVISINGYYDEKNHFVWRLRPDLTEATKRQLESEANLKEMLFERFPVESLCSIPIGKYTNLNCKDSFRYRFESGTYHLGLIWSGSSLKFGIHMFDQTPKEDMPIKYGDKYCWQARYDSETSAEIFNIVRDKITTVAERAVQGDLRDVENVDFDDMAKWKVACLYSDKKVIDIFIKEPLQSATRSFGYKGGPELRIGMNSFITSQYDGKREPPYDLYTRVGIHYFGKFEPEKTYWLASYFFGSTKSQFDRFVKDGIWKNKHDEHSVADQKLLPLVQTISEGDIIILKSTPTKGGHHDQPSMRVRAVGIVTSNIETNIIGGLTHCRCSADYMNTDDKDFDGTFYSPYRKTLHRSDRKLKDVTDYVNRLMLNRDMAGRNIIHGR